MSKTTKQNGKQKTSPKKKEIITLLKEASIKFQNACLIDYYRNCYESLVQIYFHLDNQQPILETKLLYKFKSKTPDTFCIFEYG